MPTIDRLSSDIESAKLCAVLESDGCAIVEGALSPGQLAGLNGDLETHIETTLPGCRHDSDHMKQVLGEKTIRIDGLPAKSETFVDVVQHPLLLGCADHFLLSDSPSYLLNTGQLIEIHPGQPAQVLHRDDQGWMEHPKHRSPTPFECPQLEVAAIFALSDFTPENGGTRVVPGSHKWPFGRVPTEDETLRAEMAAGSALFYLGSTIHSGGYNQTDAPRRGMFVSFCQGWLRTEENLFLTVPIERVRTLPERVQHLLGYAIHGGIGVADVGNPIRLLR
jgi:ectoine hydroxylase-related dioxygenase (phytanoyl-CoA dioxygenase family)